MDADPAFIRLLREQVPATMVVLVQPEDDLNGLLREGPDLAVVDLGSPRLDQVLLHAELVPVVGVGGRPAPEAPVDGLRAVVARPYDPSVLRWTIERVLEPPRPVERLHRWRPNTTWLLPLAELAALALALPELMGGGGVLAAAYVVAVVAAVAPLGRRAGYVVATVAAAAMILVVGDPTSGVVPYALVVAARAGVEGGVRRGAVAGLVLAVAVAPGAVAANRDVAQLAGVLATMLVFPAVALAVAQSVRLRTVRERPLEDARDVHRALQRLHRAMEAAPDESSPFRVAGRVAERVATQTGADAVVVLGGHCVLTVLGHVGVREDLDLRLAPDTPGLAMLERSWTPGPALRPEVAALDPRLAWRAVPLLHGGRRLGVLLVGRRQGRSWAGTYRLRRAARTAALQLLNALQLQRLQHLGIEAERLRLAREVEQRVATPLAHVRFELAALEQELRDPPAEANRALRRVGDAARRAAVDTATTIADLVAPSISAGVTVALHEFVRDLTDGDGASVEVHGDLGGRIDPLVEQELFGLATEAIGRALCLPTTRRVVVDLGRRGDEVHVVVSHDAGDDPGAATRSREDDQRRRLLYERAVRVGARLREDDADGRRSLELVWGRGARPPSAVRP